MESLSNYVLKEKNEEKKVFVKQLECGKNHCIALLNIGYVMEWGDNEYGQMGNRRRSLSGTPIVLKDFNKKNIIGVFAGENTSGVILSSEE